MPLLDFVVDGWTFGCYRRKLALVSTGIRPGLVTVALESWQFNCKSTRPSRGGFVRLCADATRVSSVSQKSSLLIITPNPLLRLEHVSKHVSSEVSYLAGGSSDLHREKSRSHLFSALFGFQVACPETSCL